MANWRVETIAKFTGAMKPRFLTTKDLASMARKYSGNPTLSDSNASEWIQSLVKIGVLKSIVRGIYANMVTIPVPSLNELAQFYQEGAMVSLHTVLGANGILNNPTTMTMALVPVKHWPCNADRNTVKTVFGTIKYHFIPERIVYPPKLEKYDYEALGNSYSIATPEKALADWLYLARNKRSGMSELPLDVNLEDIDMPKLKRITKELEVDQLLTQFLMLKKDYDSSDNVRYNMSTALGF